VGGDKVNERLMNRLNASGKMYLTHTKLSDRMVLRLAVGGTYTEARHVRRAQEMISRIADEVTAGAGA
jgi:aromatic-L-amino-acid decarboxylase